MIKDNGWGTITEEKLEAAWELLEELWAEDEGNSKGEKHDTGRAIQAR
jgi:hypothetical protein